MRKISLLILLLLIPGALICQEIRYGFSIGVNLGTWSGGVDLFSEALGQTMNEQDGFSNFTFTSEPRIGFNMGLLANVQLNKSLSLLPELSYNQKGIKFSGSGTYTDYSDFYSVESDMVYQLDYVDLVLPAKLSLTQGKIKPYIYAGPGLGYLVSQRIKVEVTVEGESESDSSEAEGFKKLGAHFNLGGGFDFSESVRLDFRYSFGLGQVISDEFNEVTDLKNKVTSLSLVANF